MAGSLHYRDEGSGPPLLFLHGFMGSLSDWDAIVALLGDYCRCVRIDLPGHGRSLHLSESASYELSGTAAAIGNLVEKLELQSCWMVGYSMGGRMAMHVLQALPGRLAGAIVESASPGIEDQVKRAARWRTDEDLATRLSAGNFPDFLDRWYDQPLFESLRSRPELLATVKAARLSNDPQELARALRGMSVGRQEPLWRGLAESSLPILAVAGELDHKYTDLSVRLAGLSNRIEAAIVPGTGHNVHLEEPERFARLVGKWALRH